MDLDRQEQQQLLELAHSSIAYGVKHRRSMPIELGDYSERLIRKQASFVTLKLHGELRGCIGRITAGQPLVEDVCENAYAAAFRDNRFPPVSKNEAEQLKISISLLSPAAELEFSDEQDLYRKLRPDVDGVIISDEERIGVFLPVMWERFPEPEDFIARLKNKAGMSFSKAVDSLLVQTFTVDGIKEPGAEE